jgi:hypothetical protein
VHRSGLSPSAPRQVTGMCGQEELVARYPLARGGRKVRAASNCLMRASISDLT